LADMNHISQSKFETHNSLLSIFLSSFPLKTLSSNMAEILGILFLLILASSSGIAKRVGKSDL